jgi:hypothetical protein
MIKLIVLPDPAWGQRISDERNRWGGYVPRQDVVKWLPVLSDPDEALLAWSREFVEGLADRARLDALRQRYELAAAGTPRPVSYLQRETDTEYAQRRYVQAANPDSDSSRGGTHLSARAKINMAAARVKSHRAHSRTYYANRKRKRNSLRNTGTEERKGGSPV